LQPPIQSITSTPQFNNHKDLAAPTFGFGKSAANMEPSSIAVIGIGCRFPGGATDPEKLWNILAQGRNCWSEVPRDRFDERVFYNPDPEAKGAFNHRGGHFLNQNLAAFDADFFNVPATEAHAMDPQQRLSLETTFESLENSGIPLETIYGSKTSVYMAIFTHDYDRNMYKDPYDLPKFHETGSGAAILSNRISYAFDLKGPSMTLDTGCSGSLVALHQACQSLRTRESDMSLVGGVNLILGPDHTMSISSAQSVWPLLSVDFD
jgi:acyl transferase domain-containing protein